MSVFFGTDGIRGIVNDSLTFDLSYKLGNALSQNISSPKVVIGRDTRTTGEYLTLALSGGVLSGGGDVVDIGVCTTPGIAYITKKIGADYGVVVSASHNPPQYNGLKVFDSNGVKLGDKKEEELERKFINNITYSEDKICGYKQNFNYVKMYIDYLCESCKESLSGMTIVLDGSNGATYKIAPEVFRRLGAKVIAVNCRNRGRDINNNCGSLFPQVLSKLVKRYNADVGFAFDGDGDRIIASDEEGNIIDGDNIIYLLAKHMKREGLLIDNCVVGTRHTNIGIEKALNEYGINLIRVDIGDKYVCAKMSELGLSLGGEKSGHIIIKDYLMTGDGILAGIKICEMMKSTGMKLSSLNDVLLLPQTNIDCVVSDKMRVINNETLSKVIVDQEKCLGEDYRIMVRVSGTENKIRIMVEGIDEKQTILSANKIKKIVEEINNKR